MEQISSSLKHLVVAEFQQRLYAYQDKTRTTLMGESATHNRAE